MTTEPLHFTKGADGRIWVERFPEQIEVSVEFMRAADPALVREDGDRFFITVTNGSAEYVITERSPLTFTAARLYASGAQQ